MLYAGSTPLRDAVIEVGRLHANTVKRIMYATDSQCMCGAAISKLPEVDLRLLPGSLF